MHIGVSSHIVCDVILTQKKDKKTGVLRLCLSI